MAKLAQHLERGEIVSFPVAPFPVIRNPEHHQFLLAQSLGEGHKNISFDPKRGLRGLKVLSAEQKAEMERTMREFSENATRWLASVIPSYARAWKVDQVTYRTEEEATRKLRQNARNDLLHVDAFPSRPTQGWRILRLFFNVNPTETRDWITGGTFAELLNRYGRQAGLPLNGWNWRLWLQNVVQIAWNRPARTVYDDFMLRFHNFLKGNKEYQDTCQKTYWSFAPGSVWMVMTDTVSHAVTKGRYALEQSLFISPESLVLPEESPPSLLSKACGCAVTPRIGLGIAAPHP